MKNFQIALQIAKQRISENFYVTNTFAYMFALIFLPIYLLGFKHISYKYISFAHRTSRSLFLKTFIERFTLHDLSIYHSIPKTQSTPWDEVFGERMLVLKAPQEGEKGVLLIKFSELMAKIAADFNLKKLLADYILVIEPSWSGYFDKDLLFYTQFEEDIFILTAEKDDERFLKKLNSNLFPVPLGPCDWVNPDISAPYISDEKKYDIVMNSHWGSLKRHFVLFSALKSIGRPLKVALIGTKWLDGDLDKVKDLARYYGVIEQLDFFERIPYSQVMEIVSQSKLSILLSLKEGSNRAIAESIFCNLPVIVLEEHVGGIRKNVVPATGKLVKQANLAEEIMAMLDSVEHYSPRKWGVENIACDQSSKKLENIMENRILEKGGKWSSGLAIRCNRPESSYLYEKDKSRLLQYVEGLKYYLK